MSGRHQGQRRRRRRPPRWLLGGALVAALVAIGSACLVVVPSVRGPAPGSLALRAAGGAQARLNVALDHVPRVLIIGDSIADQHGSHAAVALRAAGIQTRVAAMWGGGLLTRDQYDMGRTNPEPPAGTMMATASAEVAEFHPDAVAVYTNHNYWPPAPRDAAGRAIAYGSPAFHSMARAQITELTRRLTVDGADVYLVEPAPDRAGATIGDNAIWQSYLEVRDQLGLGVIESGRVVTSPAGAFTPTLTDCTGAPADVRPADDLLHLSYLGAGRMGTATARALAEALGVPTEGMAAPSEGPAAMVPMGTGYRVVTCEGATFPFGAAPAPMVTDALLRRPPGDPVVAAAAAPPGDSLWSLTAGGRVLPDGDAPHLGDIELGAVGERAVGMAATPTGRGYWIATSAGRVEAFGDAQDLGDLRDASDAGGAGDVGEAGEAETVVAMAAAPDGRGYWLLTGSGRVAPFGSVRSHGDLRGAPLEAAPVALAAHPSGDGYWVLDRVGNVHGFGAAQTLGSVTGQDLLRLARFGGLSDYDLDVVAPDEAPTLAVALLSTASGDGYWVLLANGAVCRFGDADARGSLHRAEIDQLMLFVGLAYYGNGPCAQGIGFGSIDGLELLVRPDTPVPVPDL